MKTRLCKTTLVLVILLLAGCAKFPTSGISTFTKRLIFTMRMSGSVQFGQSTSQYIYLIPLRISTDVNPTNGPIPIVSGAQASANGMVAGACTDYILFNPFTANPYEIWHFQDSTLTAATLIGYAISRSDPRNGTDPDTLLQCEIDMSQLVPAADVPTIKSVQANFMAMDRRAVNGVSHVWDSLGNSRLVSEYNTFLRFDLGSSRRITNQQTQLEPPTVDVNGSDDPGIDIADWSVEIQLQQ